MSLWQFIASVVTVRPLRLRSRRSCGTAVISFDFSSVAICARTRRSSHDQALTMCKADFSLAASKERRSVLPSTATTPAVCRENARMNSEKHAPNAAGSRSRNSRLNVSCDGNPFFSVRNSRRNGSLSSANSAISVHVVPPQRHEHSAITNTSHKSCRRAFPVRGSSSCENIPEKPSIPPASTRIEAFPRILLTPPRKQFFQIRFPRHSAAILTPFCTLIAPYWPGSGIVPRVIG
jgi:hypothetical protein